ncbi:MULTISPECIES: hypothetical protein [Paenibacillus]|uniref:Uncharacterized protein n=1 Tax=Paenibacillus borealis TaxID=160799 RepID=A0ABX3H9R0_PAEBO|nr:hypothetical protein [Paenibacillus borealis]OMD46229.1 hypothetical protein BSK56_17020 [Paenibacillus borealis]
MRKKTAKNNITLPDRLNHLEPNEYPLKEAYAYEKIIKSLREFGLNESGWTNATPSAVLRPVS